MSIKVVYKKALAIITSCKSIYTDKAIFITALYSLFLFIGGIYNKDFVLFFSGIYYLVAVLIRYKKGLLLLNYLALDAVLLVLYIYLLHFPKIKVPPYYILYGIALYAFIKIISSCVFLIKKKGKMISLITAVYSIFHLQLSLLSEFSQETSFEVFINLITGSLALLITLAFSVFEIRNQIISGNQY